MEGCGILVLKVDQLWIDLQAKLKGERLGVQDWRTWKMVGSAVKLFTEFMLLRSPSIR